MPAVLVFTLTYTGALFAYGRLVESPLGNLYTGINLGLIVLFVTLHRGVRWPRYALWVASLLGLGNMLGGVLLIDGQPLYVTPVLGRLAYDKVFHFLAGAGMTVIAWEAMKRWAGPHFHRGGMLLMTWLVVQGGGAVVEIAEMIGAQLADVNVGDYLNNAFDLVANALGSLIVILAFAVFDREGNRPGRTR